MKTLRLIFTLTLALAGAPAFPRTANQVYRMPGSGNIPGWGSIDLAAAASIGSSLLPRGNLPVVGEQVSSSCGSANTITGITYTAFTNLNVTITTTGRPVVLAAQSAGIPGGTQNSFGHFEFKTTTTGGDDAGYLAWYRGSTQISENYLGSVVNLNFTVNQTRYPPSSVNMLDVVGAGTYTYTLKGAAGAVSGPSIICRYIDIVAYEL